MFSDLSHVLASLKFDGICSLLIYDGWVLP